MDLEFENNRNIKRYCPDNSSDFRKYIGLANHKMEYVEEVQYNWDPNFQGMIFDTAALLTIVTDKGIIIRTSSRSVAGISELRDAYLKHKEKTDNDNLQHSLY